LSGHAWAQAQITRNIDNIKEATVLAHWEYANSFRGTTFVDVIALAKRSFDGAMTALNQSGDLP
jgi:hypothetical protein